MQFSSCQKKEKKPGETNSQISDALFFVPMEIRLEKKIGASKNF